MAGFSIDHADNDGHAVSIRQKSIDWQGRLTVPVHIPHPFIYLYVRHGRFRFLYSTHSSSISYSLCHDTRATKMRTNTVFPKASNESATTPIHKLTRTNLQTEQYTQDSLEIDTENSFLRHSSPKLTRRSMYATIDNHGATLKR